jgi:allantoinase
MASYDLVIRDNVVTPEGVIADGRVAVSGERIGAVGSGEEPQAKSAAQCRLCLRPARPDRRTDACWQSVRLSRPRADHALGGGRRRHHLGRHPCDEPQPVDAADVLEQKVAAIHKHAYSDVALYGTIKSAAIWDGRT